MPVILEADVAFGEFGECGPLLKFALGDPSFPVVAADGVLAGLDAVEPVNAVIVDQPDFHVIPAIGMDDLFALKCIESIKASSGCAALSRGPSCRASIVALRATPLV